MCQDSQTSSKCKTRQSRTAYKLLTNPAERWLALNRNRYPILVVHAQTQRTGQLQKSYRPQSFPYRPPMAMAERPFSILKVILAAHFFLSCYFKVELLHSVTLKVKRLFQNVVPTMRQCKSWTRRDKQ